MEQSLKVSAIIAQEMIKTSAENYITLYLLLPQRHFVCLDRSRIGQSMQLITNENLIHICKLTDQQASQLQHDETRENVCKVVDWWINIVLPNRGKYDLDQFMDHVTALSNV